MISLKGSCADLKVQYCTVPNKMLWSFCASQLAESLAGNMMTFFSLSSDTSLKKHIYKCGNYSFQWTKNHLSRSDIEPFRRQYDTIGSEALKKLQEISKNLSNQETTKDLYTLLQKHHQDYPVLSELWTEVHSVPDWVNWEQLQRGQDFFYRYALANFMGFALQGFVGDNSSSTGPVEVLVRTGGFSTRVLPRRILETFQLVLQVTKSLESIKPGGEGHTTAIRVRLLHSSVRERILAIQQRRPQYFDTERIGIPINYLDSIHALATFCCNHMWLQLPAMGVYPRQQEIDDYIALWRYVGYLLGTPTDHFSDSIKAKACMESMLLHETVVSPASHIVVHNFVECLKDLPPFNISGNFIEAGSRVLNGEELCNDLGFGKPSWLAYACFQGHCWLVKAMAIIQQSFGSVDRFIVNYSRRKLDELVVQGKEGLNGGSKMDFKFIPRDGHYTGKEHNGRFFDGWLFSRPVEAVYFAIFGLGCVSIVVGSGIVGFLGVWLVDAVFSLLVGVNGRIPLGLYLVNYETWF